MKLDYLDLYSILARVARYMPAQYDSQQREKVCTRLQTFAAVRDSEVFNTSGSLEKNAIYAHKDFFFSRQWEQKGKNPSAIPFGYPALLIWQVDSTYKKFFQKFGSEISVRFTFATADQMPKGKIAPHQNYCDSLTLEEREMNLRNMFAYAIKTMGEFVYAQGYLANVLQFKGWFHPQELAKFQADAIIDGFQKKATLEHYVTSKDIEADIAHGVFVDDLMCVLASIEIQLFGCLPESNLEIRTIPNPVKDSSEPCCP